MKLLLCPDSFKESLSAMDVAKSIARGFRRASKGFQCDIAPIADGGEGTVDCLLAGGGRRVCLDVSGPQGRPVAAFYGLLPDGRTAVVEMAAAAGLHLVPQDRRDPLRSSTRGVGELIAHALNAGLRHLVVGLGGSATNDGGTGMASALGVRFLDANGKDLPAGGVALLDLARIDLSGLHPAVAEAVIEAACDVTNPLTGPLGASAVFGPQKGASPDDVALLDAALTRLADITIRDTGVDVRAVPGGGAAGGLGAGLVAFCGARLRPGFDMVADACQLARRMREADWVVTGEGCSDGSSLQGKAVGGVLGLAREAGRPCLVLSGALGAGWPGLYDAGATAVMSISDGPASRAEAVARTASLLEESAVAIGRVLTAARKEDAP